MKQILLILFISSSICSFSQEKYISRNGSIQFIASTPLETIDPINNHVSCILDAENGNIVFQVKMISFKFKKALMEEHFNEKYVESEKFPSNLLLLEQYKIGMILVGMAVNNWAIVVIGKISIHGVDKEIIAEGTIHTSKTKIYLSSSFDIIISDFGIEIPRLVRSKISETVKIEVNVILKQKQNE